MVLTILGIIFLTALITFVLVKNSNPNRRYEAYSDRDYDGDGDEDEDEDEDYDNEEDDEEAKDIIATLIAMGFRKREAIEAVDACPPDPYSPTEDNLKEALRYLGERRGIIPR